MIRFTASEPDTSEQEKLKGYDDFEVTLGDVMRGERATMGKSLLDVQRELKIRAPYISAIENCDPTVFDTPGFIAGFVRSYARYLRVDPDWAFEAFCRESGYEPVHGMSANASAPRRSEDRYLGGMDGGLSARVPFAPEAESVFTGFDLRAIASSVVLLLLIAGLGYGGWTVLQEVQRVQFAPVAQAPTVGDTVDPLRTIAEPAGTAVAAAPTREALDRIYQPAALDTPVMTPRDAPIATLDPRRQGTFASVVPDGLPGVDATSPQVLSAPRPDVVLFAAAPTWVRIQSADGSTLFERVLTEGETFNVPVTEETPTLRAGNSGSLYFRVNGTLVGPAGEGTDPIADVQLASADLNALYQPVTPEADQALFALLDELGAPAVLPPEVTVEAEPAALEIAAPEVTTVSLISSSESWVRVRNAEDRVVFEGIIDTADNQALPEGPLTLSRAGNSGALYFLLGSEVYGPAGPGTSTARDVDLTPEAIRAAYESVDPTGFDVLSATN
ncbi:MAG: helix-turn-helix domain-containing protein [Shimia sp.]